jgi:hypothetical protein
LDTSRKTLMGGPWLDRHSPSGPLVALPIVVLLLSFVLVLPW